MKSISFAWTTPALLAGRKSVTRREWKDSWGSSFRDNEIVSALDRDQRRGGQEIAKIKLHPAPYKELERILPITDFEDEGFKFFTERPDLLVKKWQNVDLYDHFMESLFWGDEMLWVIRFSVIEISAYGNELKEKYKI